MVTLFWGSSIGEIVTEDLDLVPGEEVKYIEFNEATRILQLFTILIGLWWLTLLSEIAHWVGASIAVNFYFNSNKNKALTKSLYNLFKYHLGSLLFSSILNPLLRLPRVLVSGIKGRVKKADPHFIEYCVWIFFPFCYCHQAFFKYFTDNTGAY